MNDTAKKEPEQKAEAKPKGPDFKPLQEALDNLSPDDHIDLRITPEGDYTLGHYKNRRTLEKTGEGHQFKIKNVNGEGLTLHNTYYGWQRHVDLKDNMNQVYDTVVQNAVGYDFEGFYKSAEKAVMDGAAWLAEREKERLSK